MDSNPSEGKALALEPVEGSEPQADTSRPAASKAKRDPLNITTTDPFLAAAAKEYEDGYTDEALWRQAGEQSRGDASLVIAAYLRSRATALRLQQRKEKRPHTPAPSANPTRSASDQKVESAPSWDSVVTKVAARLPVKLPPLKYLAAGVGALACVGIVVWLIASPSAAPSAVSAASASSKPAPAKPPAVKPAAVAATTPGTLEPAFVAKVEELKKSGNWNVLVLYAAEWTRKQPTNAVAWHELSVAFTNLRQLGDALDAAKKTVELAPDDALLWSDLGYLNLTVQRLPEAQTAFDRALALTPDHADALCGAAAVAQKQGRSNDAEAFFAKRVNSNGVCRSMSEPTSVASVVVAPAPATRKPVRPPGR